MNIMCVAAAIHARVVSKFSIALTSFSASGQIRKPIHFNASIWLLSSYNLISHPSGRRFQARGGMSIVLLIAGNAKAYYLPSIYPMLRPDGVIFCGRDNQKSGVEPAETGVWQPAHPLVIDHSSICNPIAPGRKVCTIKKKFPGMMLILKGEAPTWSRSMRS